MLKIFLTGDNHIGLKYASHSESAILREKRISAFQNMVEKANHELCDLFVIAGDLFESTYNIAQKDVKALLNMLSCFNGIVVVLPGNHDYYDTDVKVWLDFKKLLPAYDNIMLITEYKPYPVACGEKEVVLYPAHCTSLHSEQGTNNLNWIKDEIIPSDDIYRVGIAHGAVEGETIDKEGIYFLMKRSELESIPVDAWLIGHTHVPFPRDLKEDAYSTGNKIFNAGTHVQTDVNCNTEGECFIIEIDDNKTVSAKKYISGNIRFYRMNIPVTAGQFANDMIDNLTDIDDNSVMDITFSGTVTAEEYENRRGIIDSALSRFVEAAYNDASLNRLITKELIDMEFPETSFSAEFLTMLMDEPKEAQLAYDLLKSLKEGK